MSRRFAAALAACFLLAAPVSAAPTAAAKAKGAPFCKTLKGEWVGIGTDSTRQEAESRLDKEIASWRERYKLTSVKPKGRKVGCEMYIKALNEYFCTAEAVVCR
jgi:hypothetical protein